MIEPDKRPEGVGWVWQHFNFMGRAVWGWKRSPDRSGEAAKTGNTDSTVRREPETAPKGTSQ